MNSIPDWIAEWLQPAAKTVLKFKRVSGIIFFPVVSRNIYTCVVNCNLDGVVRV